MRAASSFTRISAVSLLAAGQLACSGESTGDAPAAGGSAASQAGTASAGASPTGGGGSSAGGMPSPGGSAATAGTGSNTGGSAPTGGSGAAGSTGSIGGDPADCTEEDCGAACPKPPLPTFDALMSNGKLPDPFLMASGTRINSKREWTCRRAEISTQIQNYEAGVKNPKPPGDVTGNVSGNTLTVGVGGKSFTVSLKVPSGDGPFPAIIGLEARRSTPRSGSIGRFRR